MEPAQERELVQALEQTHDQMLEREHLDPWSFPYLYDATPEGTDSCVPGLSRLLRTVRETPTFRSVIGKRQVFQNQGCEITDRLLAEWLVERARHTNRPQAVQELTRFLATGDLPCTRVWAISGIMIEGTYEFADDLVLYSWLRLPLDLSNTELTAPGVQPAVVAFTRTETHPIYHVEAQQTRPLLFAPRPTLGRDAEDAMLCIGLIGPCAPSMVATCLAPPPWAAVMTGTGWTHTGEMTQGFAPMMPEGLDEAKRLFVAFKKLPEPRRERLRLAMDRLNRALRRPLLVQAAIDLGIALEVLFLEDEERAEMTFRLRVRAARYVAAGPDERRRIYDLIGNLYTLRSKGAHRGQLPPLVSGRDSAAVLREVATLVARTIGRMISAEPPNWTELVLE